MLTKDSLRAEFSKKWKEVYEVELFREKGFHRKKCASCGMFFWTLDADRSLCADSSCEPYGFIGKKVTKEKWDNIEMWRLFEKFFTRNSHESIKRYPVIDRVRPDLYFTIASIQNFQRIDNGNMVFVYPANPLIVPQVCLRFSDIASVGVSGRHLTSFIMPGQHAFNYPKEGYFKDRCMELDFDFLTKSMGIQEAEIAYKEDIWAMPDYSAFGPCVETFSRGLELVNHVFMQYQKFGNSYKDLPIKVNDTGWGHNRLVWFSNGTNTMYDCVFGQVVEKLKSRAGVKADQEVFSKYSELAGALDLSEVKNARKIRAGIAEKLGIDEKHLAEHVEPMQAIYAILDHVRTIAFAVADGGIPSNIGGGHNLRVILRRAFTFLKEYELELDLAEIAEEHAKFLKPLFPELKENLENIKNIIEIERMKYLSTAENARKLLSTMVARNEKFDDKKVIELYESHGVTPELIKEVAGIEVPEDIYAKITEGHERAEERKAKIDLKGIPDTEMLFYKTPKERNFTAKVLEAIGDKHVILDRTLFYPRSGGQDCDHGILGGKKVYNVEKIGNVVVHDVENPDLRKGQDVRGEIDLDRRLQLMRHHTSIHIINGAAKKVLGSHIWQAGTEKTVEKAHLDITHYKALTEEEVDRIEEEANRIVSDRMGVNSMWLERVQAEKKYGLSLYQGGVVPGTIVRVLEIPKWDIEACGGTHVENTSEIGQIIIIGSERIQDGVDRITIKSAAAAERFLEENWKRFESMKKMLAGSGISVEEGPHDKKAAFRELRKCSKIFSVSIEHLEKTVEKFYMEMQETSKEINSIKAGLNQKIEHQKPHKERTLTEACERLFGMWKEQRKELEGLRKESGKLAAEQLISKANMNQVFEVINSDRRGMIEIGNEILARNPELTVILANEAGDIVGMSRKRNMEKEISELCKKAGGSGGGRPEMAQGKVELSKLLKVMKK